MLVAPDHRIGRWQYALPVLPNSISHGVDEGAL